MKKLFIFLTMLVVGIGSMWADETYTIIDKAAGGVWPNGSYNNDNGDSTWKGSWTSTSTKPQITVSANKFLLQNSTGYIGSSNAKTGNFTISINDGYLITGYEIKFENVNPDGSHNQTITPNGKSGVTAEGTGSATVAVTGLNTRAAYFKLTGENSLAKVTKFTVTYVSSSTWTSGVTGVGGSGKYYSNIWYLKLTTPTVNDVFLDNFTLGFASDGKADTEFETYLAFSQGKFSEQNNHKASEFLAISSNSISGHSSSTANIKEFNFDETVRLNGNTDVYVCFVSKNVDGTYNLQKRGVAVKSTSSDGNMFFCADNGYTTAERNSGSKYQCQYSCAYSTTYNYPQTVPDDYHIWSGINDGDKTSGGKITIAYFKYTAPGTSGQFVHFDRFSLDFRTDAQDNPYEKYLLFSKEKLTGTGVTTSTEFESSKFTAISTNKCSQLGAFMFAFDSDSYLEGGETYYIYMGTKLGNGNFTLVKYGIFINDQMDQRYISTGFQYSGALETPGPDNNNKWQPIYYSSKCTFADSKIALNIKEADETIRTRTIYANDDVDVKTTLNIPSVFTVTPASITHSAGATSQDVDIKASFVPSSAPATEANHRYFFKLHGKYAGGDNGKTLSASTNMSEKDQWTFGGNYYDGYTIYNVGQGKYLSVSNADNSQGTFVDEASAAKFIVATSGENLSFRLVETSDCYLNNRSNILSTWKDSRGATGEGSRVVIEDPLDDLSDVYTDVKRKYGITLGKYNNPSYTQEQINTALSNAETAYDEPNASGRINATLALRGIRDGLVLNMPTENTFLRIKSNSRNAYLSNTNNQYNNINKESTLNSKETIYLFKDNNLINYGNGQVISERYADYEKTYFPTIGEVGATPTTINFSAATAEFLYNIGFKNNTRSFKINEYASDAGESGQTGGDYDFKLEEVTSLPVTFKAAGLGYATFYSPVAVKIPGDVSAYVSKIDYSETTAKITLYQIKNIKDSKGNVVIPAKTAVMLYKPNVTSNTDVEFELSDYDGEEITGNGFDGAITTRSAGNEIYYTLRAWKPDGSETATKVGFYQVAPNSTLYGFKGWIPGASGARNFTIVFDGESDPTGIVEALGLEDENVEIYDLNGRKLSSYKKGINIVNGKKVMIQ